MPEEDKSNLFNNIATIYRKSQMYSQAEEYYVQSINERMLKSPNNKQMLYNSYFELGLCQREEGKFEESLKNFNLALNYTYEGIGSELKVLKEMCIAY